MIRTIIRIEGVLFFIIALIVYLQLGGNILLFFLFLLFPDLSMLGYRKDLKTGALLYNLVHNYATGIIVFALGLITGTDLLGYTGLIIFAHVGMDHAFGYGLKYPDGFKKTHMQRV
jgi:hypothetical protein